MQLDLPLTFEVTWTFGEHVRALKALRRHRPGSLLRRIVRLTALAFVAAVLSLSLLGAAVQGVDEMLRFWLWWALGILWIVFLTDGQLWISAWQFKRDNPSAKSETIHRVTAEGYIVRSSGVRLDLEWSGIVRVAETQAFFLVFPTRAAAYYLPKRVMQPDEQATVRSVFAGALPDRTRLSAA